MHIEEIFLETRRVAISVLLLVSLNLLILKLLHLMQLSLMHLKMQ